MFLSPVWLVSSQILSGTSGPSTVPQKGKDGADSENMEVKGKPTARLSWDNLFPLAVR